MNAAALAERSIAVPPEVSAVGTKDWRKTLAVYSKPVLWRSVFQLLGNLVAYIGLLAAILWLAPHSLAASLVLAVPAAGFALRIFSIQHDCGHGSFMPSRRANDWVGRLVSPITLTPYTYWRMAHSVHHASVGHLERQGLGDVGVVTVDEYRSRSRLGRLLYRAYRNPLVLFGIGPAFLYYVRFRLPYGLPVSKARARNSILLTNLTLLAIALWIEWTIGFTTFLLAFLPLTTLAATVGVWLFYVHHEFEHTYWARESDWSHARAVTEGSSYYALPAMLHFVTGNTGIHHAHHACPRIPNYRLRETLDDHPELRAMNPITLRASFACGRLALWDECKRRLVSFREERASRGPRAQEPETPS